MKLKYEIGEKVSLIDTQGMDTQGGGYGFEESTITKRWTKDDINKYSIKSRSNHTIAIVKEKELKRYKP